MEPAQSTLGFVDLRIQRWRNMATVPIVPSNSHSQGQAKEPTRPVRVRLATMKVLPGV